jgi:acyl CoA:acetate/3-ketoacid CoA transferase alpha subunit
MIETDVSLTQWEHARHRLQQLEGVTEATLTEANRLLDALQAGGWGCPFVFADDEGAVEFEMLSSTVRVWSTSA